jgi:hypothetical protein
MDFIRPIGSDGDLDPVARVERLKDERERREQEAQKRKEREGEQAGGGRPQEAAPSPPEGPVEGEDGHLHIDIKA